MHKIEENIEWGNEKIEGRGQKRDEGIGLNFRMCPGLGIDHVANGACGAIEMTKSAVLYLRSVIPWVPPWATLWALQGWGLVRETFRHYSRTGVGCR